MDIQRLAKEDIPAVVELTLRAYDEVMAPHHTPDVLAKFRAEITPQSLERQMGWKHILVAKCDGQPVATGAIANFGTREQPRLCVSQFYTRPDLQGQGIGTALMNQLLAHVHALGSPVCHVPSSRNAITFYERFGFVPDEAQPDADDEITWMTKRF
jgi:predicted N-acetyltransferase YhbS